MAVLSLRWLVLLTSVVFAVNCSIDNKPKLIAAGGATNSISDGGDSDGGDSTSPCVPLGVLAPSGTCCPGLSPSLCGHGDYHSFRCRPADDPSSPCVPNGGSCDPNTTTLGMLCTLKCCAGAAACSYETGTCIPWTGTATATSTGTGTGTSTQTTPPPWSAMAVAAGNSHTCALVKDGTVRCWGINENGQLGNGSSMNSSVPVIVAGITDAISFSLGDRHSCALLRSGSVQCWGDNSDGQLGNGTTVSSTVPITTSGINDAIAITTGDCHTCALNSAREVLCWGCDGSGQLGYFQYAPNKDFKVPTPVTGISAAAVSAGGTHTCAVATTGQLYCWGNDGSGELYRGIHNMYIPSPDAITTVPNAASVTAGDKRTCVGLADGTLECCGANDRGQLGIGTTLDSTVPATVTNLVSASSVALGESHTCAVMAGGSVQCWGYNNWGQLGNGSTVDSTLPIDVTSIPAAVSVAAGQYHTCVVLEGGSVECWGHNPFGQLGDGTTADKYLPVSVVNFQQASDLAGDE